MEIKLSLSLEEVNGIMQALGNMPYSQVSLLVDKIRAQATPQVEAAAQTTNTEDTEEKK